MMNYAAAYALKRDPRTRYILAVITDPEIGVLRVLGEHSTKASALAHQTALEKFEHWRDLKPQVYAVDDLRICYVVDGAKAIVD
jgi:hypothetical protein